MDAYPIFRRAVLEMIPDVLLEKGTANDIARKGIDELGIGVAPLADIWGTFSMRNTEDGYTVTYSGGYGFPDGTTSMNRDADWSGANEARLLFWVVEAGSSGDTVEVESSVFAVSPSVAVDSIGLKLSDWEAVDPLADASDSWSVIGSGSLASGLGQLQVR